LACSGCSLHVTAQTKVSRDQRGEGIAAGFCAAPQTLVTPVSDIGKQGADTDRADHGNLDVYCAPLRPKGADQDHLQGGLCL